MANIFLSYAHANTRRATSISENLERAGLSLWWDKRLKPGDNFAMVIERELAGANCVVVAWSEAARNSLWVRAEANEALDARKLVQVRLDEAKPPLPFTIVELVDLARWRGDNSDAQWRRVESAARAIVGGAHGAYDLAAAARAPALQDMSAPVTWGWLALVAAIFTSALTIQAAQGGLDLQIYGLAATAGFAVSCVSLLLTLTRLVRTALATGRSS